MAKEDFSLQDHLVLFLDFLGFAEFSKTADEKQSEEVVKALVRVAKGRTNYTYETNYEGIAEITVATPEVSTFSDHVVASFPIIDVSDGLEPEERFQTLLNNITFTAANLAGAAWNVGMLIRGGLTIGKLYHRSGVVFGPAMVEAFELESRVAVYPRIVVAPHVAEGAGAVIRSDLDGVHQLRYLSATTLLESLGTNSPADLRNISAQRVKVIDAAMERLRDEKKWAELSKWGWYRRSYLEEIEERIRLYAKDQNRIFPLS